MVFIPYNDPIKIAQVLDYKRLGKQRVEARQILSIILGEAKWSAWRSHPAVLMWKPYAAALKYYYNIMVMEWIRRGYVNHMEIFNDADENMPWFMNCEPILISHRATLLRKNHSHYIQYFTAPKLYMKYRVIWPTHLTEKQIENLKAGNRIKLADYAELVEST